MNKNNQSNSEILHFSRKHVKARKILRLVLLGTIVIFLTFAILSPKMGRLNSKTAMSLRCSKLRAWHEEVESFVKINNRLPESFFEICHEDLEKGIWSFPSIVVSVGKELPPLSNDPNRFEEIVEYGLFSGKNSWFIRELKPGRFFAKILMIDQNGNIFELKAVSSDN